MAKGDAPPINGRFPRAEAAFVRAYARRTGVSISSLVKASVREYIAARPVNVTVYDAPTLVTPQTKMQREDSGKSESIPMLQQMDSARRANNAANKGFRDR